MPDTDTTLTLHISMSFYNQVRQVETEQLHSGKRVGQRSYLPVLIVKYYRICLYFISIIISVPMVECMGSVPDLQ